MSRIEETHTRRHPPRRQWTKTPDEPLILKSLRLCLQYKDQGPVYEEAALLNKSRFFKEFTHFILYL